jgi:hypothetical protein
VGRHWKAMGRVQYLNVFVLYGTVVGKLLSTVHDD